MAPTVEDETPRKRANRPSFTDRSIRLIRATASRCAGRRRSSDGSLTPKAHRIRAKSAAAKESGPPTGVREPSLWPSRPPVGATHASSRLTRASPTLRGARVSLRDASSWLARASLKLRRARVSQRDASSWLAGASSDLRRSPSSPSGASLAHGRTRERHGSASCRCVCAAFRLARAFLYVARASFKLARAPAGQKRTFF